MNPRGLGSLSLLAWLGACALDERDLIQAPRAEAGSDGRADAADTPTRDEGLSSTAGGASSPPASAGTGGTSSEASESSSPATTPGEIAGDGDAGPPGSEAGICLPSPCANGSCVARGGVARCECEAGYAGPTCAEDVDDCADGPCENGAECSDRVAGFACDCRGLAFAGERCALPRFQVLSSPGGTGVFALPTGVTADGAVVVGKTSSGEALLGSFRWSSAEGLIDLTPALGTSVNGISDDGSIVLGTENGELGPSFVWSQALGSVALPAAPGLPDCAASDLDLDGSHLAGTCYDAERRNWNAVRWVVEDGVARVDVLPNTLGGTQSEGRAINRDGTRIAGTSFANGGHAVLWTIDGAGLPRAEDVGLLPSPGLYPRVSAVSDDGASASGDDGTNAFGWTAARGLQLLPQPVPTDPAANAGVTDMDASGSVVVGFLIPAASGYAFETLVWDVTGAHRLRDLLIAAGVAPSALDGWTLSNPRAISADGNTIIGQGRSPSGDSAGWIARWR